MRIGILNIIVKRGGREIRLETRFTPRKEKARHPIESGQSRGRICLGENERGKGRRRSVHLRVRAFLSVYWSPGKLVLNPPTSRGVRSLEAGGELHRHLGKKKFDFYNMGTQEYPAGFCKRGGKVTGPR